MTSYLVIFAAQKYTAQIGKITTTQSNSACLFLCILFHNIFTGRCYFKHRKTRAVRAFLTMVSIAFFDVLPQACTQLHRVGLDFIHHKAIFHLLSTWENRIIVGIVFFHLGFGFLAGRCISHEIAIAGSHFGLQGIVNVFISIGQIARIFGYHP